MPWDLFFFPPFEVFNEDVRRSVNIKKKKEQ